MSGTDLFERLSGLLRPYAKHMQVKTDTDTNYYLEEQLSSDKLQMFAAVQVKKRYISVHLMPVYCQPELLDRLSEPLKKRMQGKSCFNFTKEDQVPWDEFKGLIASCFKAVSSG